MKSTNEKPIAIVICPDFFGYYKTICNEFEKLGYHALWVNTWLFNNIAYKILLRIAPRLISHLTSKIHLQRIQHCNPKFVEEVLVVKGEGISSQAMKNLREEFPNAKFSLYLWDGLKNTPHVKYIAHHFDSISTFDPVDAVSHGWKHRPLYSRHIDGEGGTIHQSYKYDWSFIGTIHSDRFKVLTRLIATHTELKSFAFGFIPGETAKLLRTLVNPKLLLKSKVSISTKPLSQAETNSVSAASRAVLDIEHPNQRGLTMRSIETLMINRKLITTNKESMVSDLYHPTRVCIIDRNFPAIPQEFLQKEFLPIPAEIREKYSVSTWLGEIISRKAH